MTTRPQLFAQCHRTNWRFIECHFTYMYFILCCYTNWWFIPYFTNIILPMLFYQLVAHPISFTNIILPNWWLIPYHLPISFYQTGATFDAKFLCKVGSWKLKLGKYDHRNIIFGLESFIILTIVHCQVSRPVPFNGRQF